MATLGAMVFINFLVAEKWIFMIKNQIYCSTGAFVGRINGRNYRLLIEYADKLKCEGFEFMIFGDWYPQLKTIISEFKANNINIPVIHTDKNIGDLISDEKPESFKKCIEKFKINFDAAVELGAKKAVVHIWGIPDSDNNYEMIYERVGILLDISKQYNVKMLAENCFCKNKSPLEHFIKLSEIYPDIGFIIDTRPAQFHRELDKICKSTLFEKGNIQHIHINDYKGGYKDWDAMYPIYQPGQGDVDFTMFFDYLKKTGYNNSITLEAPSMLPDRVDIETLNKSLLYLKSCLN